MDADIAAIREIIRQRIVSVDQNGGEAVWLAKLLADFDLAFPSHHAIGREFKRIELKQ